MQRKEYLGFLSRMREIKGRSDGDIEEHHCDADDILCEFIERLGYRAIVKVFDEIEKWYA